MNLNLADQYDQRMNHALDVTRKDIEGHYDFNRRVNVGEFNTRHQLSLLNDLYDKYGINADGTVAFDPKTNAPYTVDAFQKAMKENYDAATKKGIEEGRKQAAKEAELKRQKQVSSNW